MAKTRIRRPKSARMAVRKNWFSTVLIRQENKMETKDWLRLFLKHTKRILNGKSWPWVSRRKHSRSLRISWSNKSLWNHTSRSTKQRCVKTLCCMGSASLRTSVPLLTVITKSRKKPTWIPYTKLNCARNFKMTNTVLMGKDVSSSTRTLQERKQLSSTVSWCPRSARS
jgi:hypothetical protein